MAQAIATTRDVQKKKEEAWHKVELAVEKSLT
jgi:hypothetical protein